MPGNAPLSGACVATLPKEEVFLLHPFPALPTEHNWCFCQRFISYVGFATNASSAWHLHLFKQTRADRGSLQANHLSEIKTPADIAFPKLKHQRKSLFRD